MLNKKYSLLISSILFSICSFLFYWYTNNMNLLLWIVLFFIIFILFIIITIKSITDLHSKKGDKILTAFISIVILSITIIFHFNFPYEMAKINVEWNKYKKARYEVVELAKNDKLGFIGDTKSAVLPDKLKKVSQTGEVLVYQNDGENLVVGFWVNRGMLGGSKLLIYSTGGKKLIKENETHNIENIKKINDNWYYVVTKY